MCTLLENQLSPKNGGDLITQVDAGGKHPCTLGTRSYSMVLESYGISYAENNNVSPYAGDYAPITANQATSYSSYTDLDTPYYTTQGKGRTLLIKFNFTSLLCYTFGPFNVPQINKKYFNKMSTKAY